MLSFFKKKSTKKKILIVEDDGHIRGMLASIMQSSGCDVVEAADGDAAVKEATKEIPDLILMDIMLPTISGVQAVVQIRANAKTRTIPIIMCTAKNKMEDIEKSLAAGANDFISKPFEVQQLKAKVAKFIDLPAP